MSPAVNPSRTTASIEHELRALEFRIGRLSRDLNKANARALELRAELRRRGR